MGKNYVNGEAFLEERYSEDLELEDAIHTVILTLKESFEGQMTEDNIEVGICSEARFRILTPTEVNWLPLHNNMNNEVTENPEFQITSLLKHV